MQNLSLTPTDSENIQAFLLSKQEEKRARAQTIIIDGAFTAGWAGFVYIPIVDSLFVAAVQLKMINELCVEYNVKFSEHLTRTLIMALLSALITDSVESIILRFFEMTPAGIAIKIGCVYLTGGLLTYAIGHVFQRHLETSGTLENLQLDEPTRQYFAQKYQEGKEILKWA